MSVVASNLFYLLASHSPKSSTHIHSPHTVQTEHVLVDNIYGLPVGVGVAFVPFSRYMGSSGNTKGRGGRNQFDIGRSS